jgi:hypothetical protein
MTKRSKIIKGIPKSEIVWMEIIGYDNNTYYITSKPTRELYFIYKMIDDKAQKLGQSKSPISLERKFITKS